MSDFAQRARSWFPFARGGQGGQRQGHHGAKKHRWSINKVVRSYAGDWVLVVLLWFTLSLLYRIGGHKREFSLTDITIQRPFAEHETVPPTLLMVVSIIIPAAFITIISTLVYRSKWDLHGGLLGLLVSYTVTGVVTQVVKMGVGRPRPDMLNRCLPYPGSHDHAVYGLSTVDICTQTNMIRLNDGFKSFPSGHSSLSFAGLGFLSFYLAGKLHLADTRGHRTRAWLALSPLLGSTMVAVSRTADNRHHWQDVTVGSILGLAIAYVAYRAYYPHLSHEMSHLALAPRFEDPNGDEEGHDGEGDEEAQLRLGEDDDEEGEPVVPRPSEDQLVWREDNGRNGS